MTNTEAQNILAMGKQAGFQVRKRRIYTRKGMPQRFEYVVQDFPHGKAAPPHDRTVHRTANDAIQRVAKHIQSAAS